MLCVLSSSKRSLFHNSKVFGSCIIHILYTGGAKIKRKIRRQKVNIYCDNKEYCAIQVQSNTTIFCLVVQYEYNYMFRPYMWAIFRL